MKEAKKETAPSLKPPKDWFDKLSRQIKKANPGYSDEKVKSTIGSIWYHMLDTKKKKEIRGREGKTYGRAQEDTIVPNALKDYLDAVEKAANDNGVDAASLIDAVVIIDLIPPKEEAIGDGPNFGEQPATGVKRSTLINSKHNGGAMIAKENWYGVSAIVNESKELTEAIDEDQIVEELAAVLGKGLKPEKLAELKEEIKDSLDFDGEVGTFEADGITYKLISDENEAEQLAMKELKDFIDTEGPEMFSDHFVQDFYYVGDTDKRLIAGDDADHYVEDLSVERLIEEAEMEEEYEAASEAGDAEKMALIEKEAKEKVHDNIYQNTYQQLEKDPLQYFEDLGYELKDAVKSNLLSFDSEAAVKEAVRLDGWAHTLSRETGNYQETKSGMVFFRED